MALDTNGQKFRYVEAAKRWGDHPDVLKALWLGEYDLAGVAGRFAEASRGDRRLVIRSAHKAQYAFFQFPTDIDWGRHNREEVLELAQSADIIHLTNDLKAYTHLRLHQLGKPAVLHHHGTLFRNNPGRMIAEARRFGMIQAVSTIDLLRPAPSELHWVPTAYDLDALAKIRKEHRRPDDGIVRIAHAPTNRAIKSTAAFEIAVRQLRSEGLPVEADIIEGRTWAECMERKAKADIYFDQVGLGYGCNAIEAWAMGIPVVAGADEWTLARMVQEFGELPFYNTTEGRITEALRDLVQRKATRQHYGAIGKAHARKYHGQKPALIRLAGIYAKAIQLRQNMGTDTVEQFPHTAGRFRTEYKHNLQVRLASRTVQFVDGEVEIVDPLIAQRLRRRAATDARLQIFEVQ